MRHFAVVMFVFCLIGAEPSLGQETLVPGEKLQAERQFATEVGTGAISMYPLEDKIYILGGEEHCIWVFDRKGELIRKIMPKGTDLSHAADLAVDMNGNLVVANGTKISILDSSGQLLREFGMEGTRSETDAKQTATKPQSEGGVHSVAVLRSGRIVAGGFYGEGVATVFDPEGRKLYKIGKKLEIAGYPARLANLFSVGEIVVDSSDNVYILFRHTPKPLVHKYSTQGTLLAEWHPTSPFLDLMTTRTKPDDYEWEEGSKRVRAPLVLTGGSYEERTETLWILTTSELLVLDSSGRTVERFRQVTPADQPLVTLHGSCLIVREDQVLISSRISGVYEFNQ